MQISCKKSAKIFADLFYFSLFSACVLLVQPNCNFIAIGIALAN